MIQKYKLKVDARKFFDEKHHTNIYELKTWNEAGIPIQVLDEAEMVYIEYGQERRISDTVSSRGLRGWSSMGKQANFQFTINVEDIDLKDYESVDIPELMDALQKTANQFFKYL